MDFGTLLPWPNGQTLSTEDGNSRSCQMSQDCGGGLTGEELLPELYIWIPEKGQEVSRFRKRKYFVPHLIVLVELN